MSQESSAPQLRTTLTIKKFDHESETPRHFETIVAKDGKVVSVETFPSASAEGTAE